MVTARPQPKNATEKPSAVVVSAPPVDLVIGVDLGTSCSKVVIGDPAWRDRYHAVSFSGSSKVIADYLHPTRYGDEHNLKMRLMDDPVCVRTQDLLACYLVY